MIELSVAQKHLLALGLGASALFVFLPQGEDPSVTRGRELFDTPFHIRQGVGSPEMNADSCRACHQDPIMGGAGPLELNVTRFGFDNNGAGPFQNVAGGQGLSKLHPPPDTTREEHLAPSPVLADCFEQRQTPSILGDGLIDTIPGPEITANEDPTDSNSDGIFGVARRLQINGQEEIGRFGWKAQIARLADFVDDAAGNELGITTPDNGRGFAMLSDGDTVADPELDADAVSDIAMFLGSLPAPQRAGSTDPRVAQGEQVFGAVGCATCHIPALLGPNGPVPLYSNLLLHNVMPAGYRGMAEPGAAAGFFRTPPLWGIAHTAPYMHDGRAEDLLGAIAAHDGEAAGVRAAFDARSADERAALILFLEDL
ncbi:MAG: c-type cytochrome [Planctomycetes bacterium]|nr:c-type cytochrome [Planctomycetota bacterium]